MKLQEIVLDIIGIIIIGLSIYGFYWKGVSGVNSLGSIIIGLSLFIFKSSQIRRFVTSIIDKYLR